MKRGSSALHEDESDLLKPLHGKIVHRAILIYDIESKKDWSQEAGFTRTFMCGFLDEDDNYRAFWNENSPQADFRKRSLDPGGCIDAFLRSVFGFPQGCKRAKDFRPNLRWTSRFAEFWAHNGGRFDLTPMLVWLRRYRHIFTVEITFIAGCAQRLVVRIRGGRRNIAWVFVDSVMLLKMSLSQATELFSQGRKKLTDFELHLPEWERDEWERYNADDCRGLRDALLGFRDMVEEEGGSLGTTAPATAMKLWRRAHLKEPLVRARHFDGCPNVCHGDCGRRTHCDGKCHGCLHAWLKKGLFGGRTEIFERFAAAPVYYYDRNSSYPASALELMPVGRPYVQSGAEFLLAHKAMRAEGKIGFVEATVYIPPGCPIPPLPKIHNGQLSFTAGTFSGVWEYDELMLLFDPLVNGKILHVEMALWFNGDYIFNSFMQAMYAHRLNKPKEKDPNKMTSEERARWAKSEFSKLEMNSLIGKLATNPEREEMIMIGSRDSWPEGARPITGKHEGCYVWLRPRFIDADYIIPHLNMRVLALGRIAWWQFAANIVRRGGKVLMGDTDSVQATIPSDQKFLHEKELGKWKREYDDDEYEAEYVQLKNYAMNSVLGGPSIVRMKGIPKAHQNMRTFMRFRNGEELRWTEDRVSQPKHVLRELERGSEIEGIVMLDSVKQLRSQYTKRVVHDDGSTSAIVLNEGEYTEEGLQ